jgi:3-hydroxymyristoyl/3-hydroxydecanoyl-(acyl carrier protein) dehydratase
VTSFSGDHPSLAGHFPGRPIVPGVLLLREVLDTLRRNVPAASAVTGLPMVKFSSPLKPDELVTIEVDQETTGRATFSCRVDRRIIASGVIEFAPGVAHVEGA